jgi:type IV pilus assembly protein PilY1
MKTQRMQSRRSQPMQRNWWSAPAAFLVTMLALPVNADIAIPDDPLTTAARVAPNILFILDDSGSMAFDTMPSAQVGNICRRSSNKCISGSDITDDTYVGNTLYYNPAVIYQPWMQADGTRMTGGTSYSAAYGSFNLAGGGTIDLGDSGSCRNFNMNSGSNGVPYGDEISWGEKVCGGVQVFYVPKNPSSTVTSYLQDAGNYYRYEIMAGGTGVRRSEWGDVVESVLSSLTVNAASGSVKSNNVNIHTISGVPSDKVLRLEIKSKNSRHARYSVTDSAGNGVCTLEFGDEETRYCQIKPTVAGTYTIKVTDAYPDNNWSNYELKAWHFSTNACEGTSGSNGWINCQATLPNSSRTLPQELNNYATWFSYHRTRMKAAKAGASDAFGPLDSKVRVGFRTIWQRGASHDKPIPVDDGNDGRFVDNPDDPNKAGNQSTTTRSTWYKRLQSAIGYNGTPLHGALDGAGQYFRDTSATGPYGPQATADQYSCRQNFAILTTDGYWNDSSNYSGSLSSKGSWSGGVGEQDNSAGSTITGSNNQSYTYSPQAPYRSSDSGTLADVAMKYWKTDLRGSGNGELTNNVPKSDADPAFWQHMVTFGISIGLAGTSGWNSVDEVPTSATWNNPNDSENADRIDDLLHAAVNGHGAFVSASNPSEFTAGLAEALAAIAQRTSSYSNVATNAASLRTGGLVFNASYVSGTWTGAVKAWTLDENREPAAEAWTATMPEWDDREVFTSTGTGGATFPTTAQKAALLRTGTPVNYPVTGEENANYIKGDQSKEVTNGGLLRNRTSVLGDIVGSSPAYVEDTDTLYVGANDGMLHAFDAGTGKEQFAYVPNIINFSHLARLSRGDYTHKFFVDGPIVVSDRKLTPNKNLLVGALGRGGKGLYGLDVTTPGSFGTGDVEWELAETEEENMGLVLGRPILADVRTNATARTAAAVLGNGVNSKNGKAVLLVVNLATGDVIREIDTEVGSLATPNGLSAPTGVVGPDGKSLAYAYAGDLLGNIWKFDLTKSDPNDWTATKLFTAVSDVTGKAQPITGAVTVALDPRTYRRWVLFGTGSFMTVADAEEKTPLAQSMYGIIDSDAEVDFDDLQKRQIINTGEIQDGYPVRTFQAKASLPNDKKGWYVNMPADGERIVQDAQMVSNILVTASMMPTGDACDSSGSGYINAVDAFTGTSAGKSFFDLDGDGDTADNNIGGVPVGSVNFGVGMPTLPIFLDGSLIVGGTGGENGGGGKPAPGGIVRKVWSRVSWREIKGD